MHETHTLGQGARRADRAASARRRNRWVDAAVSRLFDSLAWVGLGGAALQTAFWLWIMVVGTDTLVVGFAWGMFVGSVIALAMLAFLLYCLHVVTKTPLR